MTKGSQGRSPNDQRSDAKNPTSQEHKDAMDNRSDQIRENKEAEEQEDDEEEDDEEEDDEE